MARLRGRHRNSDGDVSDDLLPLAEHIAQHLHAGRVPWEELSQTEKERARLTARETLQAILALGYRIEPQPAEETAHTEPTRPPGLPRERDDLDLEDVSHLWRVAGADPRARTPETHRDFGEWLLRLGAPLMAYDVIAEGLDRWPEDVRLRQLLGLALARSGATERANSLLRELRDEGHADEETLGMLARTHKDLWQQVADAATRERELRLAHEGYEQAYRKTGGYWTGINAATMALVRGLRDEARELAEEVRDLCQAELEDAESEGGEHYWPLATLGEAALILGDEEEAAQWYEQAAEAGAGQLGDLSSTRRNARLILEHVDCDAGAIEGCLRIPNVIVFAGHMIDQPGRAEPRFPPDLADEVYAQILDRLERLECGVSFGSAACGADILFSEAMLERSGEVHMVLPYGREQFVADSVDIAGGDWRARFDRVLEEATSVVTASSSRLTSGSVSYHYADLLVYGLAAMRARELQTDLVPMAVWDGRPGDGPGGTESIVRRWEELGHEVEVIDLAAILRAESPAEGAAGGPGPTPSLRPAPVHRVMAILFADLDDFHRLTEAQIDIFVEEFLGGIARLVDETAPGLEMRNTWGDALFLVFSSVAEAGRFALELDRFVSETDWQAHGLPAELKLRTGLHAGPVHPCVGPITHTPDCFGTHVTRAARLVEITPAGQIYASQAFAALASAEGVTDFACDYVGTQELPNEAGTCPTYHVRPAQGRMP
ncbi:MAG: TRAFs-binding domain-containing protein [Armatimonadota bacterium]|nr:TRAFs-binding domain-containing protein [Armatimonadota bacterium]